MALTKVTPSMFEGSTGGGGAENFITDNQASFAISSFTTAKYTAGTRPPATLTSSGSPAISAGFSTSNPLFNTKNFELIKPASNCQGEAWYYDFSVPSFAASRPSICTIDLPYKIASGTFNAGTDSADSDVICYIAYDDAGTWKPLEPSDFKFRSNTIDKFRAGFQTILGVTQYRLMLYVASTSASAYTIHLDKISVGPQASGSSGAIETAPVIYNSTAYSGGLNAITFSVGTGYSAPNGNWRRASKYLKGKVGFRNGISGAATGTAGTLSIAAPQSTTWDASLLISDGAIGSTVGTAQIYSSTGYSGKENVIIQAVGGVTCFQIQKSGTGGYWSLSDITAGFSIQIDFEIPIAGWDSATRISDGYDGREISAYIRRSGTHTMTTSLAKIPFNSVTFDDIAAWDNTNFEYEAKSAGTYFVDVEILGGSVTGHYVELHKKPIGGSFSAYAFSYSPTRKVNANFAIKLNAGERIAPFGNLDSGTSTLDNAFCSMRIRRCESTQAVAKGATTAFKIVRQATATNLFTSGAVTKQTYDIAPVIDTHGAWDAPNNRYYFKESSFFFISASILVNATSAVHNSNIRIRINGADETQDAEMKSGSGSLIQRYNSQTIIQAKAGDYVEVFFDNQSGGTLSSIGTSTISSNRILIMKL